MSSAAIAVSIVILTYRRDVVLTDVLVTLRIMLGQREDVEVILVDNNGDNVDRSALLLDFPHTQVIKTGHNTGVSGRNYGMDVARGALIVLLDDDVFVRTEGFIEIFENAFITHPDVGVVNVRKLDSATLTLLPECIPHTRKDLDIDHPFLTFRFVGGLVALRRSLHEDLKGFSRDLFYGEEEREYSYRIIKAGWKIYYEPAIIAVETNNAGGRRSRESLRTEILSNRYIISYLHRPALVMAFDFVVFTAHLFVLERGRIDLIQALKGFWLWLCKPGRPKRIPIGAKEMAYIRSCGGTIWR